MKRISFAKMVASGNDFVVVEDHGIRGASSLARALCSRKFGVGADGLLLLGKAAGADLRMRIINADGSEAEMCGNGARCAALWSALKSKASKYGIKRFRIKTLAGMLNAEVRGNSIRINLTSPVSLKLDIPVEINKRMVRVNFINTGVPHAVIFTEGLEAIDVATLGRLVRNHKKFAPRGTNADFVEVLGKDSIKVRTYERGVEDETLACGTGSVASALIFALKTGRGLSRVNVHTASKEVLKVYFKKEKVRFSDVWLEGGAGIVFLGETSY